MNDELHSHKKGRIKRRFVKFLVATGSVLAVYSGLAYLFVLPPLTEILNYQALATIYYRWDTFGARVSEADAAEVFILADGSRELKAERFLGHPFTSKISVQGEALGSISQCWGKSLYSLGAGFQCHEPPYGIRFYKQGNIIAEVTICWKCENIQIESRGIHRLYGFNAESVEGQRLLERLKSLAPIPDP